MPQKSPVKLGYFKDKNGTKEILTSVFVLVVHYAFKNLKNDKREGNEEDVDRLRQTFEEKRNCSFREWASPRKQDLFDLISSEKKLLRLFDASSPPQLFIMYILSHGSEGGIIFTEHPNSTFKREEIYARLLQLKNFGGCFKFINFGPCRSAEVEDGSLNYSNNSLEDVKKATQVSFVPNYDQNLAIFSSTVETQYANREDKGKRKGSWFVQSTCDVFDELERETCFADILTIVHHQIHENSNTTFSHNFQTPEFHLYPHRQLVIQPCPSSTKKDAHPGYRVTPQRHLKYFFSWERKSASLPMRRAMIFFTHESKQVQNLYSALTYYLQFETSLRNIAKENPDFLSKVKLKKDIPGCLMIVFFARIAVDDEGKINVIMAKGKTLTIGEIVCKFVKEETMTGKPKIFLFLNQPTHSNTKIDCMHTKASNAYHLSSWLTLVSCDEGTSDKLIETMKSYELRSGRSLQEMFSRVLMAANGKALMASTMQFSLDFPELPRHFVVPTFQLDNENKNYDELLINILGSRGTWLLTAAVGMGKSTFMLQLAHCLRESLYDKRQVILVQLSRFHHFFASKGQSCGLVSLLATVTSAANDAVKLLLQKRNKPMILLDGFEEVCPKHRDRISNILKEIAECGCPVVVTTAPEEKRTVEKALERRKITQIGINKLTGKQQIDVMRIYQPSKTQMDYQNMLRKFSKIPGVTENPFYLSMICQCEKAQSVYQIFNKTIAMSLGNRVHQHQEKEQKEELIRLLQNVAAKWMNEGSISMPEDIKTINSSAIVSSSGENVTFAHKSYAEFLIGRHFIQELKEKVGFKQERDVSQCLKTLEMFVSANEPYKKSVIDTFKTNYATQEIFIQVVSAGLENLFYLLKDQIELDEMDSKMMDTALRCALLRGSAKIASYLIDFDFNIASDANGEDAISCAIIGISSFPKWLKIVQKLDEKNRSLIDDFTEEKICLAAEFAKAETFRWLVARTKINITKIRKRIIKNAYKNQQHGLKIIEYVNSAILTKQEKMDSFVINKLLAAASVADVQTCDRLLNEGQDVSAKCQEFGATALHHATVNKEHGVGLISFFVQRGLRTDATDRDGETPIHYAVWAGNFQHAKELIQFSDHGYNLLQFFVVENNLELAKRVHQDDRNLINEVGEFSIFHLAASHADVAMCKWLVKEGADATSECRNLKYTALHYASKNKSFGKDIVHFLVDSLGLDVNKRSVNDETPLHCALSEINIEVAEELLDLNAESLRVKIGENTLIHYCMRWNKLTSAQFIHARDVGMVKELGKNRKSSLHVAAQYADLETNSWLVDLGVDPLIECGTKNKGTALHYVGFNRIHGVQLVEFYVSKGLKVDGNTRINPLHFALSKGNVNVAEKLLQLGANLRVKLKDFNLLHYSVIKNRLESAQFVHSKNSEMIKEDGRQGMNALHLAAQHADLRMCKWLVEQCNNMLVAFDCFSVRESAQLNKSHSEEIMQYFTDLIVLKY
ncbi:uncharacterized protein LOC135940427 [Cloeon dipterum]|uniref:uncharacterized protein LOC135940427 n=1 Tax=Cloeon dipterum TaxID=197152 RepID=UPI00321FFFC8